MPTPKNRQSKFGAERARRHIATRWNPIRGLNPQRLAGMLDRFSEGQLRDAVLLWQKILERDDQVGPCDDKRARKVAALPWEVIPIDESAEAKRHADALEHFYNNLSAVNALDENERGGFAMLVRQMHSAVAMRYAVHEIVWQPGAEGGLTAEFRHIPLQFFENTTGRLRFLLEDHAPYGADLDAHFGEGGTMVTTGKGLMIAGSVAYMFKTQPLKALVTYCEKFGIPPLHGETGAAKDSAEWNAMRDALAGFGEDLAILTNLGAKITPIELKNAGNTPHPVLIDRMDRAISRIWLGGDLATMSKSGDAVGSQPQSDDLDELRDADAATISDALQHHVDRWVIRYRFGTDTPLAYIELRPPAEVDSARELAVDEKLIRWGVRIGKKDLLQRYSRSEADSDEDVAMEPAPPPMAPPPVDRAINEAAARGRELVMRAGALEQVAAGMGRDVQRLIDRLAAIGRLPDDKFDEAMRALQADLPRIYREVLTEPAAQQAFEAALGTALVSGAAEGRAANPT